MIESPLQAHPCSHRRHRLVSNPVLEDIAHAIECERRCGEIPILWDLRGLNLPDGLEDARRLLVLIDDRHLEVSSLKRVFLVDEANRAAMQTRRYSAD